MSYSSPLSSCSTPGWNDPPPVLGGSAKIASPSPGVATGALANRHRRPVHPAIQVTCNTPGMHHNASANSVLSAAPLSQPITAAAAAAVQEPVGHAAAMPNFASMASFVSFSSMGAAATAPGSRSTPDLKSVQQQQHQQQQQHRSIFDAFTVPGDPTQQHHQQQQRQTDSTGESSASVVFSLQTSEERRPFIPYQNSIDLPPTCAPSDLIETNPNALIYTPPNAIGENNKRPATSPHPSGYVAPVKAAGDVSLSGSQLVQFLIKATYRLPAGVTRDGIQLRINQLQELTTLGQISDSCIKKLNFVVDALDRGLFDEAHQFFEQLQQSFPAETRAGWAQGIRLLVNELRRPIRIGSAGLTRHS